MRKVILLSLLSMMVSCGYAAEPQISSLAGAISGVPSSRNESIKRRHDRKTGAFLEYDSANPDDHTCKFKLFERLPKQWRSEGRWLDGIVALSRNEVRRSFKEIDLGNFGTSVYEYYYLSGCIDGSGIMGCESWVNAVIIVNAEASCRIVKRYLNSEFFMGGGRYYEPVDRFPPN